MSFRDTIYPNLIGTARRMLELEMYLVNGEDFVIPLRFNTAEVLDSCKVVAKIENQKTSDPKFLEHRKTLSATLAQFSTVEYLAVELTFGEIAIFFGRSIPSPLTSGILLSLEAQTDNVIRKEPGAVTEFLRLGAKARAHFASAYKAQETDFEATQQERVEYAQQLLERMDEIFEEIWCYGVINGGDWV